MNIENIVKGTIAAPVRRGETFLDAGSSQGFVPNGLIIFYSKKTGDIMRKYTIILITYMDHNEERSRDEEKPVTETCK